MAEDPIPGEPPELLDSVRGWLDRWVARLVASKFAGLFGGEERPAALVGRYLSEIAAKARELAGPDAGPIEVELAQTAALQWFVLRASEWTEASTWPHGNPAQADPKRAALLERHRRSYCRALVDLARVKRLKLPPVVQVNALAAVVNAGGTEG